MHNMEQFCIELFLRWIEFREKLRLPSQDYYPIVDFMTRAVRYSSCVTSNLRRSLKQSSLPE